jgi:hypothetical protein
MVPHNQHPALRVERGVYSALLLRDPLQPERTPQHRGLLPAFRHFDRHFGYRS